MPPTPLLDGNFVSFSPLDMYGGGDSLLEAGDALHYTARLSERWTVPHTLPDQGTESSSSLEYQHACHQDSYQSSHQDRTSSLLVSSTSSLPDSGDLSCCEVDRPSLPSSSSPCQVEKADKDDLSSGCEADLSCSSSSSWEGGRLVCREVGDCTVSVSIFEE